MQKSKMNNSEKVNCIKRLIQLKKQEEFLEKDIETFVIRMRVDTDVIQDVIDMHEQLSIERNKFLNPIYRTGANILQNLGEIRVILNDLGKGQKIDPESMEAKLLSLSKKIREFKLESELNTLSTEQKELEEVLHDFTVNIHKYNKPMKCSAVTVCKKTQESNDSGQPIDFDRIDNFDDLIVKTGHTQHWNEEDHLFFLKIRKKAKSIPMLVSEIRKKFPDLTAEQIINHEAWYKMYLELREKQRKSVEIWRRKKEIEKCEKMKILKNNQNDNHKENSNNFGNGENNENSKSHHLNNDESRRLKSLPQMKLQEQNEKKEMIKKWKMEKEKMKQAEEEKLKNQIEGIRSWKEQKFLLRTIEIKEALDEYRNRKMEKKLTNNQNGKKNQEISRSPALVKSFRKKDENYLRKRKSLLLSKHEQNNNNKIEKIDEPNYPRSRHQSTLLKPTKIWEAKCKLKSTEEPCTKELLYIKNLPRICTFNLKNQESNISL